MLDAAEVVTVGGDAPVRVQSMTNTDTGDVESTVTQVRELARAGSEIVRVTVNTDEAAAAVPHIVAGLAKVGVTVPIVGDFHYNGHLLLKNASVQARLEGVGIVPRQTGIDLGLVGIAARACELPRDIRHDHPGPLDQFGRMGLRHGDQRDLAFRPPRRPFRPPRRRAQNPARSPAH